MLETCKSNSTVVTIDGPAGAGKSTVARMLAESLGFDFLDTGAMYRSVTYAVLDRGIDPNDEEAVYRLAKTLLIQIDGQRVTLDGQDVSELIRSPQVSVSIGKIADNVNVRKLLSGWQRQWAEGRHVVTEGRDQGSEVFTDAICKIFLVASSQERARRRQMELAAKGIILDWETVLSQQNQRDLEDRTRSLGALKKAEDSIEFSTEGMAVDEVVAGLNSIVRSRLAGTQR